MSMKTLADEAINNLNERMSNCTDSRQPTAGEVMEAAMVCRIQELEEAISKFADNPIVLNKLAMINLLQE